MSYREIAILLWVYFTPLRLAVTTVLLGLAGWGLSQSEDGGEEVVGIGLILLAFVTLVLLAIKSLMWVYLP